MGADQESDPELSAFVQERLGKVTQRDILAQAEKRFGAKRTPSRSALSRFAERFKK